MQLFHQPRPVIFDGTHADIEFFGNPRTRCSGHDALGKPLFAFSPALAEYMQARGLVAHLSLTDETDYVVAFAVIEKP